MDTFLERQGFYDYINHVIAGVVFVVGIEIMLIPLDFSVVSMIYIKLHRQYFLINTYGVQKTVNVDLFLWNVSVILLCFLIFYLIGIIIHVIYDYIYTVDDNKYNGQLIRFEKIREIYNNDKIPTWVRLVSRLICKVRIEYYRKNIFSDPNLITSEIKRLIYKRYAEKIIKRKELPEEIINESELSSYFFAYCVYYETVSSFV